jgi:7-keto-8-aminopelargonate synthetase-like enzyme
MAAFDVMQEEGWRIDKLRENYTYMRERLGAMGFETGGSESAVIPIFIRDDSRTLRFWKTLLDDYAVYTNPFISPGVLPRNSLLRTSFMATHEREHLDGGLEALQRVGEDVGVI